MTAYSLWFIKWLSSGVVRCKQKCPSTCKGHLAFLLRRVRDLNTCIPIQGWRISNPLHYHSANSPVRKGQDSNLQPQWGDGFQDRLTAVVHPSYLNVFKYSYKSGILSFKLGRAAIWWSGHFLILPSGCFPVIIILLINSKSEPAISGANAPTLRGSKLWQDRHTVL